MKKSKKTNALKKYYGIDFDASETGIVDFYYQCMEHGISLHDADEYAILNTLMGYDIGWNSSRLIINELYENDVWSVTELTADEGSKKMVEDAAKKSGLVLDFSKWKKDALEEFTFYRFSE